MTEPLREVFAGGRELDPTPVPDEELGPQGPFERLDLPPDMRSGPRAPARDRILESAASFFAGGRIRVTGVDALIERADVAKATFYRHFPSKDDVVAAWLRSSEARWLDVVAAELEGSPPLGRLIGFWEAMGAWAAEQRFQGCPFLNTLGEIRDQGHPAYPEVSSYIAEVEAYLAKNARRPGSRMRRRWDGNCASWRWGRGWRSCSRVRPIRPHRADDVGGAPRRRAGNDTGRRRAASGRRIVSRRRSEAAV